MEALIELDTSANILSGGLLIASLILSFFIYTNRNLIFPKSFLNVCHFIRIFIEDLILVVLSTIWILATGHAYSISFVWKCCLKVYLKLKYGPLGDTLECLDAVGIIENEEDSSVVITSLKILQGQCDIEEFRRRIGATVGRKDRNGQLVYPKFYQYLDQITGYCCWKPSKFDINHHVRYFDGMDETTPSLSDSEVLNRISQISDASFEFQRSPWEILIIPKFHYDHEVINQQPKFGALIRIHHGIGDGYSFLKLIIRDTTLPGDGTINCPIPRPPCRPNMPLWKGALVFLYMSVRSARSFYTQIICRDKNPLFNSGRRISGKKILVWSQPINIQFLKEVKTKLGVGMSSTFLTAITSSVRKYILDEFGHQASSSSSSSLSAVIPMPAPNHPDNKMTNKFSFIKFQLPANEMKDIETLRLVQKEGRRLSVAPDGPMNLFLLRLMGALPTRLIRAFLRNQHSTIVISNLPGPSEDISIWGKHLQETMFWLPTLGKSGMSFSCLSYKNHFRLGLTIDTGIIQDGHKGAMRLINGFEQSILELAAAANVSPEDAFPNIVKTPIVQSQSSESLFDDDGESDAETSGHYSYTSSEEDNEEHLLKTKTLPCPFRPQRKRSLSSSSILPPLRSRISTFYDENKVTLVRCNSANSLLYNIGKMSIHSPYPTPTACA